MGAIIFFTYILMVFLPSDFPNFWTEFIAGFLGVLIGFNIERFSSSGEKKERKKDLLHKLCDELERIEKQLGHANLLYPNIWKSAVSSGSLMLLSSKDLLKLTPICNFIEGIEYEAKRLRDVKEDFMRTKKVDMNLRWIKESAVQVEKENELKRRIQKLLQDEELWSTLDILHK